MEIDDFIKQLENFGQSVNNVDQYLLEISGSIVALLKSKSPVDTGELRKSIRSQISNNTMTIKMLNYGAFQNYGVNGTQNKTAKEVQFGVEPRPSSEPFYAFKSRRFGIKPKNFFDINVLNKTVTDHIQKRIQDNL